MTCKKTRCSTAFRRVARWPALAQKRWLLLDQGFYLQG